MSVALLVIDMQAGSFVETPAPKLEHVVERINALGDAVRSSGGFVVFIQHDAPPGEVFSPGAPGWELIPELHRTAEDPLIHKQACDAFYETGLQELLDQHGVERLLVSGEATDFCVDTTVRAAASRDFAVTVVRDGHLTNDREHLDAASIVAHHEHVWENLLLPRSRVQVVSAANLIESLG